MIKKKSKINLEEFQSKVQIRNLIASDYERVVELQKLCFPGMIPWERPDEFNSQISVFPDGQFGVEVDDVLVATCSSLIINFDEYEGVHTWEEIADRGYIRNHLPSGDTLYGIEIMVDPEFRGMKLARRLYEARKNLARQLNLKRIVIGGRLPGYETYWHQMTPREYVEKVAQGTIFDPVLTVQIGNGFALKKLVPSYLEEDEKSHGCAALLEWVNLDFQSAQQKTRYITTQLSRMSLVQYELREIDTFDQFARQCTYYVDVASNYKSDFVLFPELFTLQLLSIGETIIPSAAQAVRHVASYTESFLELFSDLAIKYDVNIVAGSHPVLEGDALYNASFFFRRDGDIKRQNKLHISAAERRWWGMTPGNKLEIFQTDQGKFAILIGYDIEFPELSRIASDRGAEAFFVPFTSDDRQSYLKIRYCSQARAIENQTFVIAAGTVGNLPFVDNIDIHYAQSAIFTPSHYSFTRDAIACEADPNVDTVLLYDLDMEVIRRHRMNPEESYQFHRRKDLYNLTWEPRRKK